jgi:nucleotide-binding universal stress UspA family protein
MWQSVATSQWDRLRQEDVIRVFSKILLSVDGSAHSARAVDKAAALADSLGSEVVVFHVRETLPGKYDMDLREGEVDLAANVANDLKAKGIKASSLRESAFYGFTAQVVVAAAEQFGADVIVMGSRGRSDLTGLLLGSVTHKVLQLSDVPVLVVR